MTHGIGPFAPSPGRVVGPAAEVLVGAAPAAATADEPAIGGTRDDEPVVTETTNDARVAPATAVVESAEDERHADVGSIGTVERGSVRAPIAVPRGPAPPRRRSIA